MAGGLLLECFSEREWACWFERNTEKQEKTYEYRRHSEQSNVVDEEDIEVSNVYIFLKFIFMTALCAMM